jgi:hypothetical protein
MWMCDGKPAQTALADDLGTLLPLVKDPWTWSSAFFEVLRQEWDGLDKGRFDKYMYLVRVYIRKTLELATDSAVEKWTDLIRNVMEKCCLKGLALGFHIMDVFYAERPKKTCKQTVKWMRPFLEFLKGVKLPHIAEAVFVKILTPVLKKEKYRIRLKIEITDLLRDVDADTLDKRTCGVEALNRFLEESDPQPTPESVSVPVPPTEPVPDQLQKVMQKFYPTEQSSPTPTKKQFKRKANSDFFPAPSSESSGVDITIALPTPMKRKSASERREELASGVIGSGVKKRKVMFNLKLNQTQRR